MMRVLKDMMLLEGFTDTLGRVYDRNELLSQLSDKPLYGELGHGTGLTINLDKVSHRIENIRVKDGGVSADIHVLDTPCGRLVESLLAAGANLRTSIRATGFVGDGNSVTDLKLLTFDLVEA